ncbi:TPA: hypothetical protein ACNVU8_003312 [Acinetobacter baumannii]
MKPEQFIRDFGEKKAREIVEGAPEGHKGYNDVIKQYTRGVWFSRDVLLSDLKRLVESLGLVNKVGGLKAAKFQVKQAYEHGYLTMSIPVELNGSMCIGCLYIDTLEQAIRDHESIYGGGDE